MNERKEGAKKGHVELLTSVQLTGVGLVFLHDLSDLLSFQRRVENLVQPGVSLPAVDKVHELVQRDKRLPLGATGAETKGCSEFVLSLRWRETVMSLNVSRGRAIKESQGLKIPSNGGQPHSPGGAYVHFLKDALYLGSEAEAVQEFLEGFPREIIRLESFRLEEEKRDE